MLPHVVYQKEPHYIDHHTSCIHGLWGRHQVQSTISTLCMHLQIVLREFLNPRGWKPSEDTKFFLDAEQINQLCDVAEQIFQAEPSVLRLKGTYAL